MRGLTLSLLTLLFFCADAVVAQGEVSCFQGTESVVFLDVIKRMNLTPRENLQAVKLACSEVDLRESSAMLQRRSGTFSRSFSNVWHFVYDTLYGPAAGAFSKLNATESQRRFRAALERIKMNPNRYERLRDATMLTMAYQGAYDSQAFRRASRENFRMWTTPESVIESAEKTGFGGDCVSFSTLLAWSLLQVSRPVGNTTMALDESSFSATMLSRHFPGQGVHSWVRVYLPRLVPGKGLEMDSVDLDTTHYRAALTVLHSRFEGLSEPEMSALSRTCEKVIRCLSP